MIPRAGQFRVEDLGLTIYKALYIGHLGALHQALLGALHQALIGAFINRGPNDRMFTFSDLPSTPSNLLS